MLKFLQGIFGGARGVAGLLTTNDYMNQQAVPADAQVAYGPHPNQFGELYLPAGAGPHPVALLIHGGCWQAQYGLAPLGPLCAAIRATGVAVWSLEYRRLGGEGGWPITLLDVAAGADVLRELATHYPLDLARVVAVGHSAGGHLALWLAARPKLPVASPLATRNPLPLHGVLALAALADLWRGAQQGLCDGAIVELLGGTPNRVPDHYVDASPASWLPLGVPHHHFVGAHDPIVPPGYLKPFVQAAVAVGDKAQLELLPNAGHFEPVIPSSAAWPRVELALHELFKS